MNINLTALALSFKAAARDAFDTLPKLSPRRAYGRTRPGERAAMKFFFSHGISREEIAVKYGVGFQTVYAYTR